MMSKRLNLPVASFMAFSTAIIVHQAFTMSIPVNVIEFIHAHVRVEGYGIPE